MKHIAPRAPRSRVHWAVVALALSFPTPSVAGDVRVVQSGSTLRMTGDDLGANLYISGMRLGETEPTPGLVLVQPSLTTVNGVEHSLEFTHVARLKISLGDGKNGMTFNRLELDGGVQIASGTGLDGAALYSSVLGGGFSVTDPGGELGVNCDSSVIGGRFDVRSRNGTASVWTFIDGCEIGGNVRIAAEDGPNHILPSSSHFARSVSIKTGAGADEVTLLGGSIGGGLKLSLGTPRAFDNTNTFSGDGLSVGGNLTYVGGSGEDHIDLNPVQVGGSASYKLGNGANTLTLEGGDSQVGGSLRVFGGDGVDTVSILTTQIGEDASLNLGQESNSLAIQDSQIGDDLAVNAGAGNDVVTYSGAVTIGDKTKLSLGGGTNTSP